MRPTPFAHWLASASAAVRRRVPLVDRHRGVRQFVKFCLVGSSNVVVYFACYLLLTRLLRWYFLAGSVSSFLVAVSWSFYWNRRWTFRPPGGQASRYYRRFVLTNAVSGAAANAALYVLVTSFGWHDLVANFAIIGATTAWNFMVTKFWAFGQSAGSTP